MNRIIPPKLCAGDEIRIIAPSGSMGILGQETMDLANERFAMLGLQLSFGRHVLECDALQSSSISSRLEDLHQAFSDPLVKGIFTVIGGFNVNQLLEHIDYESIKKNPKILCGYSDITALQHALFAKTGLVTYSGPHYSTFGMKQGFDWTLDYVKKCLFSSEPYSVWPGQQWSDDAWFLNQDDRHFMANEGFWVLNEGEAHGRILGANLCTLNLLQGTNYWPDLQNSILLIEDDDLAGEFSAAEFDRNLQSLIHQPGFVGVKGLLIGRFQKRAKMSKELLSLIIKNKRALDNIPVIANIDFGHTSPMMTYPIGGDICVSASQEKVRIEVTGH